MGRPTLSTSCFVSTTPPTASEMSWAHGNLVAWQRSNDREPRPAGVQRGFSASPVNRRDSLPLRAPWVQRAKLIP